MIRVCVLHARAPRYIRKGSFPVRVIQNIALPFHTAGAAKHRQAFPFTDRGGWMLQQGSDVGIACYVEVQVAILIVVAKRAAGMPGDLPAESRRSPNLRERAVLVVSVEKVHPDGCNQNVRESVVVEINGIRSGPPIGIHQPGARRYILKPAVPEISVEEDSRTRTRQRITSHDGAQSLKSGSVYDQQVHPAIVVIVQPGATAAVSLHDPLLLRGAADNLRRD